MKTFCLALLLALCFASVARAEDNAQRAPHGAYEGVLTDPSNATNPNQGIRIAFFSDGNFSETNKLYQSPSPFGGALLGTPGMGMFEKSGPHAGKAVFSLDLIAVGGPFDGQVLGTETVTWTYIVASDGTVSGPWTGAVVSALFGSFPTAGTITSAPANRP